MENELRMVSLPDRLYPIETVDRKGFNYVSHVVGHRRRIKWQFILFPFFMSFSSPFYFCLTFRLLLSLLFGPPLVTLCLFPSHVFFTLALLFFCRAFLCFFCFFCFHLVSRPCRIGIKGCWACKVILVSSYLQESQGRWGACPSTLDRLQSRPYLQKYCTKSSACPPCFGIPLDFNDLAAHVVVGISILGKPKWRIFEDRRLVSW